MKKSCPSLAIQLRLHFSLTDTQYIFALHTNCKNSRWIKELNNVKDYQYFKELNNGYIHEKLKSEEEFTN